eukprot:4677499-Alexandrium_andersonii.AAC.1
MCAGRARGVRVHFLRQRKGTLPNVVAWGCRCRAKGMLHLSEPRPGETLSLIHISEPTRLALI